MQEDFFRPIHYLGSKLRVVETIKDVVDQYCQSSDIIVDLFSGSGTVSKYLSYYHPVIAADIQEYSRILNSALLLPKKYINNISLIKNSISKIYINMLDRFESLVIFENSSLNNILNYNYNDICSFLELGPLLQASKDAEVTKNINLQKSINEWKRKDEIKQNKIYNALTMLYGGVYFSIKQSLFLDACMQYIDQIEPESRNIFHAAILSTASEIVNTIGKQFAQPINPRKKDGTVKYNIMKKIYKERSVSTEDVFYSWLKKYNDIEPPKFKNIVIRNDYENVLKEENNARIVYADPPYTRYHYSRYYHVLETIALRDFPEVSKSNLKGKTILSRGVYRPDRYQSTFGIKSKSILAFDALFKQCSKKNAIIILSYSPYKNDAIVTPRILTIEKIKELCSMYYSKVRIISCGDFAHSKLNKNEFKLEASNNAELLIIGENPKESR